LGRIQISGEVPQNEPAAIDHFMNAADAGHQMAALELGLLMMPQDPDQAKRRLRWGISDDQSSTKIEDKFLELRERATLALAWLNFIGTTTEGTDRNRSKDLVQQLLRLRDSDSKSAQQDPQWFVREFISPGDIVAGANVILTLIGQQENAELARQGREQARAELYSFITHSIPSSMQSVVAETEQSLEVLQSELIASTEVRDHLIRSLSSTLGRAALIDNLMATHKLLIAGKERLQTAWESEQSDWESPLIVVIDAVKQAVAQTLFTEREYDQIDLDEHKINQTREVALAQLTSSTTNASVEEFLRFISAELPFLILECKPDVKWRIKRGGIRFSVLISVISELVRNALRYREPRTPLGVRIERHDEEFVVKLTNTIAKASARRLRGTNRGQVFIREFAEAISELDFFALAEESTYTATLSITERSRE